MGDCGQGRLLEEEVVQDHFEVQGSLSAKRLGKKVILWSLGGHHSLGSLPSSQRLLGTKEAREGLNGGGRHGQLCRAEGLLCCFSFG